MLPLDDLIAALELEQAITAGGGATRDAPTGPFPTREAEPPYEPLMTHPQPEQSRNEDEEE